MTDTPGTSLDLDAEQVGDERSFYLRNPCWPSDLVCVKDLSKLGTTTKLCLVLCLVCVHSS